VRQLFRPLALIILAMLIPLLPFLGWAREIDAWYQQFINDPPPPHGRGGAHGPAFSIGRWQSRINRRRWKVLDHPARTPPQAPGLLGRFLAVA